MRRIKLIVAYDGTNYHGWQIQTNGITIESELNRCLCELLKDDIKVIGASRTDSGVHALGNVAVFDTNATIPPEKFAYALNQRLPEDIRIQSSTECDLDFHPRFCNSKKTYEYRIYLGEFPLPTKRLYCHFTYLKLNTTLMKEACRYFIGEHDFRSFCVARTAKENTMREIYELELKCDRDELVFTITGNGFLYNMVRIIVGTILEVGQEKYPPSYIAEILNKKDRNEAGPTAPAKGLLLYSYEFL